MHHRTPYGAGAYHAIGVETGVAAADPLGLVVMLYDGAIQAIVRAETHLANGDIEARGTYTSKAIDIVMQGLSASLDRRVSGALVDSLSSLYEYMGRRLIAANVQGDRAIYEEVRTLLGELRTSWVTLRTTIPVAPAPARAAYGADPLSNRTAAPLGRSLAA
jgi:flagellar protein FliS